MKQAEKIELVLKTAFTAVAVFVLSAGVVLLLVGLFSIFMEHPSGHMVINGVALTGGQATFVVSFVYVAFVIGVADMLITMARVIWWGLRRVFGVKS